MRKNLFEKNTTGLKSIIRRFIGRGVKLVSFDIPEGGKCVFAPIACVCNQADKYRELFLRPTSKRIETNLPAQESLALKSYIRDYFLQNTLLSEEYSFDNIFLVRNPYGDSPLSALALFKTDFKCGVKVTVKGKSEETDFSYELSEKVFHRVPILFLLHDCDNKIILELIKNGDSVDKKTLSISTKGLFCDAVNCVSVEKESKDPAFSNVLITGGLNIRSLAFDKKGDIRYYHKRRVKGYGIFPMTKGHYIFMEKFVTVPSYSNPQCAQFHDMDYLGRVHRTYFQKKGVHHTSQEKTPGGNLLIGSNSMEGHTEDVIIEVHRITGKVVYELRIDEVITDDKYKDLMDWAHVNSVEYYDDSLLISLRNVHSVICVEYSTKRLKWILADENFWKGTSMEKYCLKPKGEIVWFYQQHAAAFLGAKPSKEDGCLAMKTDVKNDHKKIMVFDNHWHRRRPVEFFDGDDKSYVSFFEIDEKNMTVSMTKKIGLRKTRIRSNAEVDLDKRRVYAMAGSYAEPENGVVCGAVYEYDYDTEEMLGKYNVNPGFFRACKFEPDFEELAKPLNMPSLEDYYVGDALRPTMIDPKRLKRLKMQYGKAVQKEVTMYIEEDALFVNERDHALKHIYFSGENGVFDVNFDTTYQTMDLFKNDTYNYVTRMDMLTPDCYDIFLDIDGELIKTGKYVNIT